MRILSLNGTRSYVCMFLVLLLNRDNKPILLFNTSLSLDLYAPWSLFRSRHPDSKSTGKVFM